MVILIYMMRILRLTPLQVQMMLRELVGMDIIGGDVVEVAPQYDPSTNTAHVAAQLLFELFALLALRIPVE